MPLEIEAESEKQEQSKAWISIKQISEVCHLGQSTIRNLIAKNVIPHMRIGRKILIPRESFFRWWDSEAANLRIPSQRR